jgi:hypothetical protein
MFLPMLVMNDLRKALPSITTGDQPDGTADKILRLRGIPKRGEGDDPDALRDSQLRFVSMSVTKKRV